MKAWGIVFASSLLSLSACATIVSGNDETVSVTTPDVQAASCKLQNGKGQWTVASTPGTATVKSASGDISVTCTKEGYETASTVYGSNIKGWLWGNLGFGGIVGIIVDLSTGAGYDYPKSMPVAMTKSGPHNAGVTPVPAPAAADQNKPGPAVGS